MSEEDLIPVFIPALVTILISAEDKKGSPLEKDEVISIRDAAAVIMMEKDHAEKMAESRGYADIDPENCWYDWQMVRREMGRKPDLDAGARLSFNLSKDDTAQATIKAKETIADFRNKFSTIVQDDVYALIKTKLTDPRYSANMWLVVEELNDTGFIGRIFELPSEFVKYRVGQHLNIDEDDILDWMINFNGQLFGGYTLRVQRQTMSAVEQKQFDSHIGVVEYMD